MSDITIVIGAVVITIGNIRKGSDNGQVDIGEAGNNRALRTKWERFCTPMWRLMVCEATNLPSLALRGE